MASWLNLGFSRSNADSGCGTVNHKFSGEIVRVWLSTSSSFVLWTWWSLIIRFPWDTCGVYCECMGFKSCCYRPSGGNCVWSLAQSQAHLQSMLDSALYVFSIYVQALDYGHEICLMTNRVRSRSQAAELSFLRRVLGSALEIEGGSWTPRGTKKIDSWDGSPPFWGFPGMPNWEETLWNPLERM